MVHGHNVSPAGDLVALVNQQHHKIRAFLINEKGVESIALQIPKDLEVVPETTKVHQVVWIRAHQHRLFSGHYHAQQVHCPHHGMSKSDMDYSYLKSNNVNTRKRKMNV